MIPRYSRPDMVSVWAPETKFRIWFDIEAAALEAMAELGTVPRDAARKVREVGGQATFDIDRIDAIERETRHDVIAFLTYLAEIVGPEARFVHQGMTSSDVLDTCLAVQLTRSADILLADIEGLLAALERRAREHRLTPTIGRSHGIHAEPTTFGLKLASFFAEFDRARTPPQGGEEGDRDLCHLGARRHLRRRRSARRGICRGKARPQARAHLDADRAARPARPVLRHARRDRIVGGTPGDGGPALAAHPRSARLRRPSRRARRAPRPCRTSATRC